MNQLRELYFDHIIRPLPIRGKRRLLSWLLPASGQIQVRLHGLSGLKLDLSEWVQRTLYLGAYELEESQWVKSVLRPGDTAIDVGANFGFYTSLFWRLVKPAGRVLAFEPNPMLFHRLKEWFEKNKVSGVELFPNALGAETKMSTLHVLPAIESHHNATLCRVENAEQVEVNVLRLEDILESKRISRVRLLKVDVEGFELEVLKGVEDSLSEGVIEYILVELNDYWLRKNGTSPEHLTTYCQSLGFEISKGHIAPAGQLSNLLLKHRGTSQTKLPGNHLP